MRLSTATSFPFAFRVFIRLDDLQVEDGARGQKGPTGGCRFWRPCVRSSRCTIRCERRIERTADVLVRCNRMTFVEAARRQHGGAAEARKDASSSGSSPSRRPPWAAARWRLETSWSASVPPARGDGGLARTSAAVPDRILTRRPESRCRILHGPAALFALLAPAQPCSLRRSPARRLLVFHVSSRSAVAAKSGGEKRPADDRAVVVLVEATHANERIIERRRTPRMLGVTDRSDR